MAKFMILFISLVVLAGSIEGRFPSKYRVLYPRSIPEGAKDPEPSSKEIDSLDSKELIPKNLLNTPKDLKGEEPYGQEGRQKGYPKGGPESLDGPYGPQGEGPEGGYPRGGPEGPSRRDYPKRRRGPDRYPGGPEGPEGPEGPGGYGPPRSGPGDEGLGFGPDGPCMSKRCNPFRSRKPSYRAYLQRLMSRKMGGDGPYGPPPPPIQLPMIEEVIIVRRIPVILNKLLIAVALDPSKFKKEEGGKPGDGKEPVGPPAPEYGNEEEVLPKDQPYGDKKKEGYQDLTKSKQGPKDKEFDESMGEEELVAKKYSSQGEKEEKKLEPYSNKDKEIKLKYDEKEYLEKPGKYGEGNDLEPRSSELKKEKESNANKIEP